MINLNSAISFNPNSHAILYSKRQTQTLTLNYAHGRTHKDAILTPKYSLGITLKYTFVNYFFPEKQSYKTYSRK